VPGAKPDEQNTPEEPQLELEEIVRGEGRTLALKGELDMKSAETLERAMRRLLAEPGSGLIVLDLGGVSFMDSTGLRVVLLCIALCVEDKRELELLPGPDQVQSLFEISGLDYLPFASPEDGSDE
jgi:anti-anti-sigma factor